MISGFGQPVTMTSVMLPGFDAPGYCFGMNARDFEARFGLFSMTADVDLLGGGGSSAAAGLQRQAAVALQRRGTVARELKPARRLQVDPEVVSQDLAEDTLAVRIPHYIARMIEYIDSIVSAGKAYQPEYNQQLASNYPEILYAMAFLTKLPEHKNVSLTAIKSIYFKTLKVLAERFPHEALSLIHIFRELNIVNDLNKQHFEKLELEIVARTFPDSQLRRSRMMAHAEKCKILLQENSEASMLELGQLAERYHYCFGFLVFAAVVQNNILAKAVLRQMAETDSVHRSRATQLLANFG